MLERTRAYYRDFMRVNLQIKTPRERWEEAGAMGWDREPVAPPYGAQPPWQMEPSNYALNIAIDSACNEILRECRVQNALHFTDITIPAQTATGPYVLRLDALPGFTDGGVMTLRRSYWTTGSGSGYTPLRVVNLTQQDKYDSNWMNDGPATPSTIAAEGNLIYLLPGPDQEGTLRLTVGSGVLAPMTDEEGYDGIPQAYDDAINYIALVAYSVIPSGDAEMQKRAAAFAGFAQRAIERITLFYDNAALDEFDGQAVWKTGVTRYARRN